MSRGILSGVDSHKAGLLTTGLLTMYAMKCIFVDASELHTLMNLFDGADSGDGVSHEPGEVVDLDGDGEIDDSPEDLPAPIDATLKPDVQDEITEKQNHIDDAKENYDNPRNKDFREDIKDFIEEMRKDIRDLRSGDVPPGHGYH